jgi:hypothetical protein
MKVELQVESMFQKMARRLLTGLQVRELELKMLEELWVQVQGSHQMMVQS